MRNSTAEKLDKDVLLSRCFPCESIHILLLGRPGMAANPLPGDTMPRGSSHEILPESLVPHECSVAGSAKPAVASATATR